MRITTASAYDATIAQLQRRQQQLAQSQEQLSSGKRVLRPSDDPGGAAAAERALAAVSRNDAEMRALQASRRATQLTESALGDAGEMLQQARELLLAAGNGSYDDAARRDLASRLRGLREDLLAVANRGDGAGRHLFAGQGSGGSPFVDGPGGVNYVAVAGQADSAAGAASPLSLDGRVVWLQVPDPADPARSLSMFDALGRIAGELELPGRSGPQIAATVSRGLGELDAAASHLLALRSRAGETLNRLEGLEEQLGRQRLEAQQARSQAEDLDMVAAISDFQNQQSGYDAALKTYSIVQRMSLFDYLR